MKLIYITLILLTLSVTVSAQPSYSSYPTDWQGFPVENYDGPRWDLHGGAAFLSGNTRSTTTYTAGLTYQTPFGGYAPTPENSSFLIFSADAMPITTLTNGNQQLITGLIGYRKYAAISDSLVSVSGGVGVRYATQPIPELNITENYEFAWGVKGTLDFAPGIFIELGYIAGQHPNQDGATLLNLGARF